MTTKTLTIDEEIFFKRVAITMMNNGVTDPTPEDIAEGCKAVLKRDEELFLLKVTKPDLWDDIVHEMACNVHGKLNA